MVRENYAGTYMGRQVYEYTVSNGKGCSLKATNLGATIMDILVPDAKGNLADVALGFAAAMEYLNNKPFFGSTVGRVAGRIAGGTFEVDGKNYEIPCNENGVNLLHSGGNGLHAQVWTAQCEKNKIRFSHTCHDLEDGFPANLDISVTMTLTEENTVRIEYEALAGAPTLWNPTNHTYFNLGAENDVLGQIVTIHAEAYTPVNESLVPTGEIAPLAGTPLDFRMPCHIGKRIDEPFDQLRLCRGYDHNYVLNSKGFRHAAAMEDPRSGRRMEIWTDRPGLQFYTANALAGICGKERYAPRSGCCFETQLFPDGVHHPGFPPPFIEAGKSCRTKTEYRFYCG